MNKTDMSLTIDEYHAHPAVSRSILCAAGKAKSAKHFHYAINNYEPSEAMRFGNAFHKFILEPELYSKFAVPWTSTASFGVKAKKAEEELEEGEFLVPVAWEEKLTNMAQVIKNNKLCHKFLSMKGDVEKTFFFHDEEYGVDLKCRPDFFTNNFIIDLKKVENKRKSASRDDFKYILDDFDYDLQAYMYSKGVETVLGEPVKGFIFIVVEDDEPYGVNFIPAGKSVINMGEIKYHRYMSKYLEYKNSDCGYAEDTSPIEYDEWQVNKITMRGL